MLRNVDHETLDEDCEVELSTNLTAVTQCSAEKVPIREGLLLVESAFRIKNLSKFTTIIGI